MFKLRLIFGIIILLLTHTESLSASSGLEASAPVVMLEDAVDKYPLGRYLEILEDTGGNLTIEDIRSKDTSLLFTPNQKASLNFGVTGSGVWTRFKVQNNMQNTGEWFLELNNPRMQRVDVYIFDSVGTLVEKKVMGSQFPFQDREINNRNNLIRLTVKPQQQLSLYSRTQTETIHYLIWTIWSVPTFVDSITFEYIGLGLFYGIVLALLLYNLFIFVSVKNRSYLYYIFYIASFGFYQAGLDGLSYQYFWPEYPRWGHRSVLVFGSMSLMGVFAFTKSFLELRVNMPKTDHWLSVLVGLCGILSIFPLLGDYKIANFALTLVVFISSLFILFTAIRSFKSGFRPARYFVFAFSILNIATFIFTFMIVGILPSHFLIVHSIRIGAVVELFILSLALADRINILKNEKIAAQNLVVEANRILNEELESQVEVRTRDLQISNNTKDKFFFHY